jgi:phosphatidylglycerol:prolipoprotein diacylglycerol transferase
MLPILYQSHDLILYSYPLLMGLGWGVGYQIFFSQLDSHYPRLKAQILFWGIFLFAWLGAKVLFYLSYPKEDTSFIKEVSFWTGGGFVFYGGFIGGLIFLGLYKLFDKKFSLKVLWPMLPSLAIGHGIGRIGCLLAGCCFGKPTNLFWGIYLHDHYRHPTQALEAIGLIALGIYLLKSKALKNNLIQTYLLGYGFLRLFIEAFRGDIARGAWGPLTPSQWISITLIFVGVSLKISNNYRSLRKTL